MSENKLLTPEEAVDADLIAQAVKDGFPDVDEICPRQECGRIFKNYHHFLRCELRPCPMSDGKGTLLERMAANLEVPKSQGEPKA